MSAANQGWREHLSAAATITSLLADAVEHSSFVGQGERFLLPAPANLGGLETYCEGLPPANARDVCLGTR